MTAPVQECDAPGCTGLGEHRTATGGHLCDHCNDNRIADEAACMAGNGATPPLAAPWWRRIFGGTRTG
jgi:hypothetical protein